MWLFRGAQSAVFFYMTCTPCAEHFDRKRRKRCAAKGFRDPLPLPDPDDPNAADTALFHQPFPFSTNAFWEEEIALGPGPPARRKNGKANNQRSINKHKRQQQLRYQMGKPNDYAKQQLTLSNNKKKLEEGDESNTTTGDRWNWKRYQREDEVLWGKEIKGSSVGVSGKGATTRRGRHNNNNGEEEDDDDGPRYFIARNPEVNDLHPPVVSGPTTRSDTRWMLQPPPSAQVMAGKVRLDQENGLQVANGTERNSRQSTGDANWKSRAAVAGYMSSRPKTDLLSASPSEKAELMRKLGLNENFAAPSRIEKRDNEEEEGADDAARPVSSRGQEKTPTGQSQDHATPKQQRKPLTLTIPTSNHNANPNTNNTNDNDNDDDFSDFDGDDDDDDAYSAVTLSPIGETSPNDTRPPLPNLLSIPSAPLDHDEGYAGPLPADRHLSRDFLDHLGSFDSFNARSNAPLPPRQSVPSPASHATGTTDTNTNTNTDTHNSTTQPESTLPEFKAAYFPPSVFKGMHVHKHKLSNSSTISYNSAAAAAAAAANALPDDGERKMTADSGKAFPVFHSFPPVNGDGHGNGNGNVEEKSPRSFHVEVSRQGQRGKGGDVMDEKRAAWEDEGAREFRWSLDV